MQVNGANNTSSKVARTGRAESVGSEGTVAQEDPDDEETSFAKQMAYADKIIPRLRTATYQVNAALLYSNGNNKTTPAFARISGKDWTYFVMETEFTIGRPVRPAKPKLGGSTSPAQSDGAGSGSEFPIQIDLGPDQQVSRVHAIVSFVGEAEAWKIIVNGRNGLLVDDRRFEKGQESWLHSGAVISILGTQMMFTLPQGPLTIHPSIISQTNEDGGETEDEYADDSKAPGPDRGVTGARQNGSHAQHTQSRGYDAGAHQNYQYAPQPLSNPGTPLTVRSKEGHLRSKPSPAYGRGLVLETTEDIDYAADSARDIKPPHSYAQLIGQAIVSSSEEKLTLAKIYDFIKEHYAFYRYSGGGWQNSIRHNLSLSKSFEKVARRTDEPGKGMKWQIVPDQREEFLKKNMVLPRKAVAPVGSAGPDSPLTGVRGPNPSHARPGQPATSQQMTQGGVVKKNQHGDTPPLASYPTATESFTPDRGPRAGVGHHDGMPALVNGGSTTETPLFMRSRAAAAAVSAQDAGVPTSFSPPDFGPGTNAKRHSLGIFGDINTATLPLQTPLGRAKVHLAPPSTAQLPSQHMLFSSPAPFWKYADLGSTPARPLEGWESPDKKAPVDNDEEHMAAEDTVLEDQPAVDLMRNVDDEDASRPTTAEGEGGEGGEGGAGEAHPSSPPMPTGVPLSLSGLDEPSADETSPVDDVSPSRTISRPVSRRLSGPAPLSSAPLPKLNFGTAPVLSATSGNPTPTLRASAMPQPQAPQRRSFGGFAGEEEGIDLAK